MITIQTLDTITHVLFGVLFVSFGLAWICILLSVTTVTEKHDFDVERRAKEFFALALLAMVLLIFAYLAKSSGFLGSS